MNLIQKANKKFEQLTTSNAQLGFVVAVIKKYGDAQAGYLAALLTYYAFLSLFPLLLILTTVLTLITSSQPGLQSTVIDSVTNYFPLLGTQLSEHIETLHRSGLPLFIGLVVLFYGARGVADAFRNSVNVIWEVPAKKRDGFPKTFVKSIAIILIGGIGLVLASSSASLAGTIGQGITYHLLSIAIDFAVMLWLFYFLISLSLPAHAREDKNQVLIAAVLATVGVVILQGIGGYILARALKHLDVLYSYYAIPLGLLFWIYLQAQVFYYAMIIAAVNKQRSRKSLKN